MYMYVSQNRPKNSKYHAFFSFIDVKTGQHINMPRIYQRYYCPFYANIFQYFSYYRRLADRANKAKILSPDEILHALDSFSSISPAII